jgi:dTDP-6-deoxy-L-talose 4-dehydrogenase (NAD+)
MTQRVFITGGRGFVGRQIVHALARRGVEVHALIRPGQPKPDGATAAIECADLFAEPVGFWIEAFSGMNAVVHAAWYAEPGKYLMSPKNLGCLAGTMRMAEAAVAAGMPRFVGIGTCVEYALSDTPLAPTSPLEPSTPYGAAKAAAYLALSRNLPEQGISFAWCRLFYLYGPGEDPRRLVPMLHLKLAAGEPVALSRGTQIRDYLDVVEAGDQIARVALGTQAGALNICSGDPISIADLARRVASEYDAGALLKFGAMPERENDPPFIVGVPSLSRGADTDRSDT